MLRKVMLITIEIIVSAITVILLCGIFLASALALFAWDNAFTYTRIFMWAVNIGSLMALFVIMFEDFDEDEDEEEEEDEEES